MSLGIYTGLHILSPVSQAHSVCFMVPYPEILSPAEPFLHDVLLHLQPRVMKLVIYGLRLLKLWCPNELFFLSVPVGSLGHSDEKPDQNIHFSSIEEVFSERKYSMIEGRKGYLWKTSKHKLLSRKSMKFYGYLIPISKWINPAYYWLKFSCYQIMPPWTFLNFFLLEISIYLPQNVHLLIIHRCEFVIHMLGILDY